MNYRGFCYNMLKVNSALRVGGLSPDDVEVMVTKSSGDTLICFMHGEEIITYIKL